MQNSYFNNGEIRNYTICFVVALVVEVLAFIWVWLTIDNRVDTKLESNAETKNTIINENERKDCKQNPDISREDRDIHPIRLLFDLENVKSMVRTVIKKRPNRARMQILLSYLCITIFVTNLNGIFLISKQCWKIIFEKIILASGLVSGSFFQQVYLWSPDWSAYVSSIDLVVHTLAMLTIVPFLVKVIKVIDVHLAIIGFTLIFSTNLIRGSWLNEIGNFLCLSFTSCKFISKINLKLNRILSGS